MISIRCLLLIFVLIISCQSPQKILDNGTPEKAFEKCLLRLNRKKINVEDLQPFQQSFDRLKERDAYLVQTLIAEQQDQNWPKIHSLLSSIQNRQQDAAQVVSLLNDKGYGIALNYYPVEELLRESAEQSAAFFYKLAQEALEINGIDNRLAARKAHHLFVQSQTYVPHFRDTDQLINATRSIGTTHILFQITSVYDDLWQNYLLSSLEFPIEKEWQVIHREPPVLETMDFEIHLSLSDLYVGPELEETSQCTSVKEVENGFKIEQVWSEQDSAYVNIKTPTYQTVSVTVFHHVQLKYANIFSTFSVIDATTDLVKDEQPIEGSYTWKHEYDAFSGDLRALNAGCNYSGGNCFLFPSDERMLENAMDEISWSVKRRLKKLTLD